MGTRALAYDGNGNCVSEIAPQVSGKTVARTFGALNRRTGLSLGTDISSTYVYDDFGRVSSMESGGNTVAFDYRAHGAELAGKRWLRNGTSVAEVAAEYDKWGNVAGISFGVPGNLHSFGYLYDQANRRVQTNLPDGTKWLYGYDRLSQVVSGERVAEGGSPVDGSSFHYAYDGIGSRTSSREGSLLAMRRYRTNSLNQYAAIAETGVIPIHGRADADATVTVAVTLGGQTTVHRPARNGQAFDLDIPVDNSEGPVNAHVAVDAVKGDGTLDVELHRRLSGDYALPAAVSQTLAYDADGNLLAYDGWTYTWNGEDRLASAEKEALRLEFAYDYLGRRFEKKVYENGALVKHRLFVYDGFQQIAEYDALDGNALASTTLWQPAGLDAPLLRNGQQLCVSDANKNIIALVDANGIVTDTYLYDPFGNCTHTGNSTNPFRFSSEFFDQETGLVYYNYRYYSPKLGRWTKRDPVEEEGGENLYQMIHNNTVGIYDILGQKEGKCLYCGPDYTNILANTLNDALVKWNQLYGGYTNNILKYSYYRILPRWRAMSAIGPNLDNIVELKIDSQSGITCPSGDICQRTYEICGKCVHDHFIGNIMYAFWMKLFDFSVATTYFAGHVYQMLGKSDDGTYRGAFRLDYSYDQEGYKLGFLLYASKNNSFSRDNVCNIIQNSISFQQANQTGKDYSKCKICPIK